MTFSAFLSDIFAEKRCVMAIFVAQDFPERSYDNAILVFEVDVTLSEQIKLSQKVSKHPKEFGESFIDHSEKQPTDITLDCFVSGSPLAYEDYANIATSALNQAKSLGGDAAPEEINEYLDEAKTFIYTALEPNAILSIETSFDLFYPFKATRIDINYDDDSQDCLKFSLTLEEVEFVSVKEIDMPETSMVARTKPELKKKAGNKKNGGKKQSKTASKQAQQQAKTPRGSVIANGLAKAAGTTVGL